LIFTPTKLSGAFVVDLERREDERGFFARAWCAEEFEEQGLSTRLVQCNVSFNHRRGTVRGMHYQQPPHAEAKLIRCTRGAIQDVIVDLRADSPTYLEWISIELSSENRTALYVPEGFAHGYQTLSDETETFYQVSEFYTPNAERGLRFDDPSIAIEWQAVEHRIVSEKDLSWAPYESAAAS
jgi:dTDP-4-dehydrorhamnose 3,5-epimerase